MTLQYDVTVRDAQMAQLETVIGTAPKLQLRSGAPPANCAAADTGTLLCELTLPSDWLTAPSGGTVTRNGTWSGTVIAAGTAAHFRLKNSALSVTGAQGTVTITSGGGDLTLNNPVLAVSQQVDITTFSITRNNA